MSLDRPKKFGNYELLDSLATGGMGELYIARKPGPHGISRLFALKILKPEIRLDERMRKKFQNEAHIATQLKHNAIVPVYEYGFDKGHFFISMDYVDGMNLREFMRTLLEYEISLPEPAVLYVVKEICSALDYVYRCPDQKSGDPLRVVHGDISPHNIMITYEGEVKLIDFGIAKSALQNESTTGNFGRLEYASPQKIHGTAPSRQSDIFSLGQILWEMWEEKRYHGSAEPAQIVASLQKFEPKPLIKGKTVWFEALNQIVLRATAADPKARYRSADEFESDLQKILSKEAPDFGRRRFRDFIQSVFTDRIIKERRLIQDYLAGPEHTDPRMADPSSEVVQDLLGAGKSLASTGSLNEASRRTATKLTSTIQRPVQFAVRAGKLAVYSVGVFIALFYFLDQAELISGRKIVNQSAEKIYKEIEKSKAKTEGRTPASVEYFAYIESRPAGATIQVDGSDTGKMTPAYVKIRWKGFAEVQLKAPGYKPFRKIEGKRLNRYFYELTPDL